MKVMDQLESYFVLRKDLEVVEELSNAAMLVFEQLLPMEKAKECYEEVWLKLIQVSQHMTTVKLDIQSERELEDSFTEFFYGEINRKELKERLSPSINGMKRCIRDLKSHKEILEYLLLKKYEEHFDKKASEILEFLESM